MAPLQQPLLEEKALKVALFQFLFPFSLNRDCQHSLKRQLKEDGFIPFSLRNLELETAFYGPGYRVSHLGMERYYLPFTNNVIFPHGESEEGFQRYSKRMDMVCTMESRQDAYNVKIHSVDVVLCPFDLGFITVRTESPCEGLTYTQALEFVSRFRVLQNVSEQDNRTRLVAGAEASARWRSLFSKCWSPASCRFWIRASCRNRISRSRRSLWTSGCMCRG
ncbi:hypothetical protein LJK88_05655 [Paenibacillus sp. P26]|nr:hypothetical protein LJK88_05655 [Paenibacillus sp. P26]